MHRDEFLKLCSSLLGGLGLQTLVGDVSFAHAVQDIDTNLTNLGKQHRDYLALGISGMVQAKSWFDVHWGASLIAGYFLCEENSLPEPTVVAIQRQLDYVIRTKQSLFAHTFDEPFNESLKDEVIKSLKPAIEGGLRAHGHAVIFTSLAMKAFSQRPDLIQPTIIRGLCGHLQTIGRLKQQKFSANDVTPSKDPQAMVDSLFRKLAEFEPLLGIPQILRPNFTHMTTHTEAMVTLHQLGYHEIVTAGSLGQAIHLEVTVPKVERQADADARQWTLERIMKEPYWNTPEQQAQWQKPWNEKENPNGDWVASGHLFKVLYSFHRLSKLASSKAQVEQCARVLLERYFNPEVRGG